MKFFNVTHFDLLEFRWLRDWFRRSAISVDRLQYCWRKWRIFARRSVARLLWIFEYWIVIFIQKYVPTEIRIFKCSGIRIDHFIIDEVRNSLIQSTLPKHVMKYLFLKHAYVNKNTSLCDAKLPLSVNKNMAVRQSECILASSINSLCFNLHKCHPYDRYVSTLQGQSSV